MLSISYDRYTSKGSSSKNKNLLHKTHEFRKLKTKENDFESLSRVVELSSIHDTRFIHTVEGIVLLLRVTNYKLPSPTQKTTLTVSYSARFITPPSRFDSIRFDSKGTWKNGRATRVPDANNLKREEGWQTRAI